MSKKVLVTTIPFASISPEPMNRLREMGFDVVTNQLGRRLTEEELGEHIQDVDYFIAGLDKITPAILNKAKKLKIIARVGAGYDNVPIEEAKERGIKVTYTPEAGTEAVAELVLGLIIDCARHITRVDRDMRRGNWTKHMGSTLRGKTVGVIGVGRIGKALIKLLGPFGVKVLGNDLVEDEQFAKDHHLSYVSKEELLEKSDFVSLNLSGSKETENLINHEKLCLMKPSASLINAARGQVVNLEDLYIALKEGKIASAAIDVYPDEPYTGKLIELENVILTAHIGAATTESRLLMETEAVDEVIRFDKGELLKNEIV